MGKKNSPHNLGKSIIRDRFSKKNKIQGESFIHTSQLNDGYDWSRLNLQSVTEQSNLEDFLATAELAGTEFVAEKLNVKVVDSKTHSGLLSLEEKQKVSELHKKHASLLRIPRRPPWDKTTTPEDLSGSERETFLDWRRTLASLQEVEGLVMTPYEKNLDFWRQLWRVIERSDIVVQIVDARNPLLFYCEDLATYVKEVDPNKVNLLLINKADFLTDAQRDMWAKYFTTQGIQIAFWSAVQEVARQEEAEQSPESESISTSEDEDDDSDNEDDDTDADDEQEDSTNDNVLKDSKSENTEEKGNAIYDHMPGHSCFTNTTDPSHVRYKSVQGNMKTLSLDFGGADGEEYLSHAASLGKNEDKSTTADQSASSVSDSDPHRDQCSFLNTTSEAGASLSLAEDSTRNEETEKSIMDSTNTKPSARGSRASVRNTGKVYSGPQLLEFFKKLHSGPKVHEDVLTLGMVGYPNVGKSSTVNAILKMKKVPVSATPGRTKHFQTLYVDQSLMLCDCPGLVFPSFAVTKADLIINGVLSIDQMREHIPPISLVCELIPKQVLEDHYGIIIPNPEEGEDPNRPPAAEELLNAYGYMRGYMTSRGLPDCPRSSRYILKEFVNGHLLYCKPPPGMDPNVFNPPPDVISRRHSAAESQQGPEKTTLKKGSAGARLDNEFFSKEKSRIHARHAHGERPVYGSQVNMSSSQPLVAGKPWKKHNNRKRKEKLRRLYNHMDD
ncbi:hypothetical protein CHS0354_012346 [Potamilus streckersoni]|uniref:Large subunit GTPase 1 homolog n=1 Tax=Potamilus streckersoni TaxID=2493646 RepID=A0AAE0SJP3_9BIVA|nr:hypothetical protein CHS0354_012346 [Potamilus streckersoni]